MFLHFIMLIMAVLTACQPIKATVSGPKTHQDNGIQTLVPARFVNGKPDGISSYYDYVPLAIVPFSCSEEAFCFNSSWGETFRLKKLWQNEGMGSELTGIQIVRSIGQQLSVVVAPNRVVVFNIFEPVDQGTGYFWIAIYPDEGLLVMAEDGSFPFGTAVNWQSDGSVTLFNHEGANYKLGDRIFYSYPGDLWSFTFEHIR